MPRPRTPRAKAATEARDKKDPQRFKNRTEPKVTEDLGAAPDWMVDTDTDKPRAAWAMIASEVPWLNASHRGVIEIAATIRGRLMGGQDVGVQALNLLRQMYGQMGATPADASKVTMPDGDEKDPDADIFD